MMKWCGFFVLLCLAIILEGGAVEKDSSPESLVKRAADPNTVLIQQQAHTISQMQARITTMENKINNHDTAMSSLKGKLNSHVGFSVHFPYMRDGLMVNDTENIKFPTVIANVGNAYNASTGVFNVTVTGLYAFFLNVEHADDAHGTITLAVMREHPSGSFCRATAYSQVSFGGRYDEGVCEATIKLWKGQHIYVRKLSGDNYVNAGWNTAFVGFLVAPDV